MPRQADGAREGDEEARRKVDATLSLQSDLERLDALLCDAETGGHTNILSARMMIARVCAAMQAVEAGRRRPAPRQSRRVDGRAAALAQEKLFAGIAPYAVIVCDRYSAYKKLARMPGGLVILAFCWSHVRRDFIDCAAGRPRLEQWCQGWNWRACPAGW